MPEYNYKCKDCNIKFAKIHSIKDKCDSCESCNSKNVKKIVSTVLTNTETCEESQNRFHEEQAVKDIQRFYTDDKFAANVTGADDPNSQKRKEKILREQAVKNKKSLEQIKKQGIKSKQ